MTLNICNISLHLEKLQNNNIENEWQFLLRHAAHVGKFTFSNVLPLVYFCSEVFIFILFLVKFIGASSLIDRFEIV